MSLLLAAADNKITDAITLMVVGMAVVFGALAILLAVVTLINRLLRQPPPQAVDDTQLIAVLTAAATAALGQSVRVTDAQPADSATSD